MVFLVDGPAPRYPSQIYEALREGLALFTVLAILAQSPRVYRRPGLLTGVFVAGYGLASSSSLSESPTPSLASFSLP